jgi:putative CocE/NonD family hydrolase
MDQRFVDGRTDVLTYMSEPLQKPVRVSGAPEVNLYASTSGSDADWAVKLIDVFPDTAPSRPAMGGYELAISLDIFRGRYRNSFEHPSPIPAGKSQHYRFALPNQNYMFLPGHRIMVQIQSTLFPLYDRNAQSYVDNPLYPKSADFRKATVTVMRSAEEASAIWLPVAQ